MAAAAQTRTEVLQYLGSPTPGGLVARIQCFHHHSPGSFPRQGRLVTFFVFPGGSEDKASACHAGDSGSTPGLRRSPGEGNGNPLQNSCLENPTDRGAWRATVPGVTKSRTRLSEFTHSLPALFQRLSLAVRKKKTNINFKIWPCLLCRHHLPHNSVPEPHLLSAQHKHTPRERHTHTHTQKHTHRNTCTHTHTHTNTKLVYFFCSGLQKNKKHRALNNGSEFGRVGQEIITIKYTN